MADAMRAGGFQARLHAPRSEPRAAVHPAGGELTALAAAGLALSEAAVATISTGDVTALGKLGGPAPLSTTSQPSGIGRVRRLLPTSQERPHD